jgi:S1-C subfamily serine protease
VIPANRGGWLLTGLVVAVLGVLIHGFAQRLRPAPAPTESAETPEPVPAPPALRPDLEKTPLAYHSDYWRQLGERARPKILLVGSARIPAIVVAPGLAVSSPGVVLEQGDSSFKLLGGGPQSGFALLEVALSVAPQVFTPSDPASLHPGLLVAAVSLDADGSLLVAPGTLATAPREEENAAGDEDSLKVSIAFPHPLPAAAIVDLDGKLVGAAFDVGGSLRLLSSDVLLRLVDRLRSHPFCYAIEVGELDQRVKDLLKLTDGVIVERVRETSFVPAPSIREGDVILEWAGGSIATPDEFRRSYQAQEPGALVSFEVRRGRGRVRGRTVMPGSDCRPADGSQVLLSAIGMTLVRRDQPETAWEVLSLSGGGPAARGGIAILDRILEVDGLQLGSGGLDALRSFERRPRPLAVLVRRDRRVRLLAVSPNEE